MPPKMARHLTLQAPTRSRQRQRYYSAIAWKRASSSWAPSIRKNINARGADPIGRFRRFWERTELWGRSLFGGVAPRQGRLVERLAQVLDQVVHVLEADGQSDEARRDPERRALLGLEPLMGRRLRMGDEAFGVAEIVGNANDRKRVGDPESRRLAAGDFERHDRAAAFHLPFGEGGLRMIGAPRVEGAEDRRMLADEIRDPACAACLLPDTHRQSLQRLQQRPGVERRQRGARLAEEIVDMVGDELLARQNDAAEHAPLAVDVFGGT